MTPLVRRLAFAKGAVDDPKRDDRRIHKAPLPRWGGLAIYGGIVVSLLAVLPFANPSQPFPLYLIGMLLVGGVLVIVGALDDLYQYSAKAQFYLLLLAGVAVQFLFDGSGRVQVNAAIALAVPVTMFTIFIITKTMDTIDGVDGLASGLAAITAVTLCIVGTWAKQPYVPIIAAAVAGASMGFLQHNYNPAKIIMGTGGAYILGFFLASLCIAGAMQAPSPIAIAAPLFLFFVPLFDAAQVMVKRYRAGDPLTQPDKRHIHHVLLGQGLNQRETVLTLYGISALVCAIFVLAVQH